jgi:aminopeptidase N
MTRVILLVIGISLSSLSFSYAQLAAGEKNVFTHADTLRGSITPERAWWDVLFYHISVTPDFNTQTIRGMNEMTVKITKPGRKMQIDLQDPMVIDTIYLLKHPETAGTKRQRLSFRKNGNAWLVSFPSLAVNSTPVVEIHYHGKPRAAIRPPWDGGWIWTRDKLGRPWMSVACQGLGASVWYPCKDHQSDEPDSGAMLSITVPDTLMAVGNGRLLTTSASVNGKITYTWKVVNPINNYDIIPYIGKYRHFHVDYPGEKGTLNCDYWVIDYNLDKAKDQFRQADSMLHCFEFWMGAYPFYEDGFKLVEAPHLGMEHQSAVAYGNHFANGYLGKDLSGTGWGLKWDFIIVHESGHEWFGNNITTNDLADMWVHESFTNYSETLYTTCQYGAEAGNDYVIGTRQHIRNDKPIIGSYGVNNEGSGDMYYKGGNMLHMIRRMLGDSGYRGLLHGLSSTFYHKTVTTQQIEAFISQYAKKDLSRVFDQYLRSTSIPVLEYKENSSTLLSYRWTNCVKGFNMPVQVSVGGQPEQWITPTEEWKTLNIPARPSAATDSTSQSTARDSASRTANDPAGTSAKAAIVAPPTINNFQVDRNFYITVKKIG